MNAPTRLTAADFAPEVLQLFDRYVHGLLDRRGFIAGASRYAAGSTGAVALLAALSPNFAAAQRVSPEDPRLQIERIEYPSPEGSDPAGGYLVRPVGHNGPLPLVVVAHENRGLNPHIEDIARRLGLAGYLVLAPDALHPLGGYPGGEDQARELFRQLDQGKARADFVAAARWLLAHPDGNGRLGAVGFCYGGAITNYLATQIPELRAAVPFYGGPAPLDQVDQIQAELLLVFAGLDERVNASWPDYEAALKAAGKTYEAVIYPDTQHGFNNDTTPRFDEAAAAKAWQRTLDFFAHHLRG
ncbi:MAG: dienelactone hydrolase family protein [Xanthomonadales bacterium]|nr:dienelactone hydrolase family protein [Xanthomonadales bacterium]